MHTPPLAFFFWQAATATPGAAPWPLTMFFETAEPPVAAVLSAAPFSPVVSTARPLSISSTRPANLSRSNR